MTIAHLLSQAQKKELRTEMEVFLSFLLGVDRSDLIAWGEDEIPVKYLSPVHIGLVKLCEGMPVAYLINMKEFYGIPLFVDERVLIPRGATELLVDYVLERKISSVLELGTGSGAISVALKNAKPELDIVAGDVSTDALVVANKNCVQYEVDMKLVESDLLASIEKRDFDCLVANLPYIGDNDEIQETVRKYEPHLALFGGEDGLNLYERLFDEIVEDKWKFKWIMGEVGFNHGLAIEKLCKEKLPDFCFELKQDLQGLDRHFILTR